MGLRLFDAHCHLQDFGAKALAAGVAAVSVNGTAPSDWEAVAQLRASSEEGAGTSPRVVANYGLHPWRVGERGEGDGWLNSIREHLEADLTAGLGETVSTAAVRSLLQPSSITNFWHPSRDWTS